LRRFFIWSRTHSTLPVQKNRRALPCLHLAFFLAVCLHWVESVAQCYVAPLFLFDYVPAMGIFA